MAKPNVTGFGLLFLTREPIADMATYAKVADEEGLHSFWLAEGPHWFRNFGGEIRGALTTAAYVAAATKRIRIGIGIVSPYLRHPTVLAMEAGALDEMSNHRLIFGLGVSKTGVNYVGIDIKKMTPVAVHRDAIKIMRGIFGGKQFDYKGSVYEAHVPPLMNERPKYRPDLPIFVGATGPKMIQVAGELADGLILPGLTTLPLVRFALDNVKEGARRVNRVLPPDFPVGACLVASVSRDGSKARDRAREMATTYLVNKLVNIKDQTLLDSIGLTEQEAGPLLDAIKRNEKGGLHRYVSDEMLRKTAVIAGTPDEAAEVLADFLMTGVTLPMLEVHGDSVEDKVETIRLLAREVCPTAMSLVAKR